MIYNFIWMSLPKTTWFERVFNTPSHHRVHHASNIRYLDCNHAGVLILWDKLKYIFLAPGWSHDGEDKHAKVLRAQLGGN